MEKYGMILEVFIEVLEVFIGVFIRSILSIGGEIRYDIRSI